MRNPIWRIMAVRTGQMSVLTWLLHALMRWPWTGTHALGLFLIPALCAYFVFVFVAPWTWGLPIVTRLRGRRRVIALTFDDGPSAETTPRVLETLAQRQVLATFFVLGEQVEGSEKLLQSMAAQGHTIGLHGQTHMPLVLPSWGRVIRTLADAKMSVSRVCPGTPITWLRPPHGFKSLVLPVLARRVGLRLCAWSVNAHDYQLFGPEEIARYVLKQVKPGAIVLLHDGARNLATADALPLILDGLAQAGYTCIPLSPGA